MNPKKGLERLLVRLRPETIEALKVESRQRADEATPARRQANASEIVQEALDQYLPKIVGKRRRRAARRGD